METYLLRLLNGCSICLMSLMMVCSTLFSSCNDEIEDSLPIENNTDAEYCDFVSKANASEVATLFFTNLTDSNRENKLITRFLYASNTSDIRNKKKIRTVETLYNKLTKTPSMYLVNFEDGGYTIVSASRKYYPILAYSETNTMSIKDLTTLNDGLSIWIEEVEAAISQNSIDSEAVLNEIQIQWSAFEKKELNSKSIQTRLNTEQYRENFDKRFSDLIREAYATNSGWMYAPLNAAMYHLPEAEFNSLIEYANSYSCPLEYVIFGYKRKPVQEVGPLIGTEWSQGTGFNDLVPHKYPAGCVAIAMAQIMKFHKYPLKYNWAEMPLSFGVPETARLVYDIGKAVKMEYDSDGSGSNINKAYDAFSAWGYNVTKKDHDEFDIRREVLYQKRPVYMRGDKHNFIGLFTWDGHAWVCEGVKMYDNRIDYFVEFQLNNGTYSRELNRTSGGSIVEYFYLNWGWGGKANGWYLSTNDTNPEGDNFKYDRQNLYIYPR